MRTGIRTDLAAEERDLWRQRSGQSGTLPGVRTERGERDGFEVDVVEILDERGEQELCKPIGRYETIRLDALNRREEDAFRRACTVLSDSLRRLLSLSPGEAVLVAGLGNEAITPDAVGPLAAEQVMVTRHLRRQLPETFEAFREVSAFRSGVLGTTGLESADLIRAVAELSRPAKIVAIDALCARDADKLCRTVQLSDAGIVPGSGVGNARAALSRDTLGVPVIAVGVPTVVDAASLCVSLTGREPENGADEGLIVTPRDIDSRVRDAARLIGYSVNLALHDGLTVEDVDMFLS